jgi:hypothetical protein
MGGFWWAFSMLFSDFSAFFGVKIIFVAICLRLGLFLAIFTGLK